MKITQFGLCYSPNLGDGIIAECLGHALRVRAPGAEIRHIDLSGRQDFGQVTIANRELLLKVLDRLPLPVRQALAGWKLTRLIDGVEAQWRDAARCDLAVIGGGQILSDANLNFPIKVGRAARLLAQAGTPTAVYAVGVSRNWTPKGTAWFREVLGTNLQLVAPRDGNSAAAWSAQVQGGPAPVVVPDPGLLAADCYGPVEAVPGLVGLCVTDFDILGHHADSAVAGQGGGPAFYAGIARALIAGGCRVRLFTNGAAEDRALRDLVAADLAEEIAAGRAEGPADPQRPAGLAAQVAECATVIAHRLHACIIAYSYRRPVVGLGWDSKLESFFAAVGQPEAFVGSASVTPEGIASLALTVAERGIDPQAHAVHTQAAWAGIDRLLACATAPAAR